jgi:hypothetical protein
MTRLEMRQGLLGVGGTDFRSLRDKQKTQAELETVAKEATAFGYKLRTITTTGHKANFSIFTRCARNNRLLMEWFLQEKNVRKETKAIRGENWREEETHKNKW